MSAWTDRIRHWAEAAFTREVPFKVLSLLFAMLLWAWVQTQQIVAQRTRAQVKWTFPEQLTWVDPVPKTLVVTVRGPQGLVRNVKKRTLRYDVDLSEAEIGPVSVDFSSRALKGVPEGVQVVQISPPGVDIELDRRMDRVVRINPAIIGEVASGYRLENIKLEPSTSGITGPRSIVRNIAEVSTDVIDVTGLTKDTVFELPVVPKSRAVHSKLEEPVKITVSVQPIIAEKTFTEVPVMSRADGWRTVPSTAIVTLSGPAIDMRELTADRISVQAHMPAVAPVGKPLMVIFDPSAEQSGLEVVHQGAKDVTVVNIVPKEVRLERAP
jgi:YbbR domain-containing protein